MKKVCGCWFLLIMAAVSAWSDVQIQVLDSAQRKVRFVYTIEDKLAGSQMHLFPGSGFLHDRTKGAILVESVFDRSNHREMSYAVQEVATTRAPQIRIDYPEPLREGEIKSMQVSVVAYLPPENMGRDSLGRNYFIYETSHMFEYAIPRGQYVIYVNQPVSLYEKEGIVYLKQVDRKNTKITIHTRGM